MYHVQIEKKSKQNILQKFVNWILPKSIRIVIKKLFKDESVSSTWSQVTLYFKIRFYAFVGYIVPVHISLDLMVRGCVKFYSILMQNLI